MIPKSKIIARAIIQKQYKDIPEWVMKNVDFDVFKFIMCDVYANGYGLKHLEFFHKLNDYCQFGTEFMIKQFPQAYGTTFTPSCIYAAMIEDEYDWKCFMRRIEDFYSKNPGYIIDYRDFSLMARVQFYFYKRIPKSLTVGILKYFESIETIESEKTRYDTINCFIHDLYQFCVYIPVNPCEFSVAMIKSILSVSHKFYWVKSVFSLNNIWDWGIPYYIDTMPIDNVLPFLIYMAKSKQGENLYLPDCMKDFLYDIVADNEYSQKDKNIIYDVLILICKQNINNIRFLFPFSGVIREFDGFDDDITCLVEHNFSNDTERLGGGILVDYGYLEGILPSYANDTMQLKHIRHLGGISSLIENKNSVVHTLEGIIEVIKYSSFDDILKLLHQYDVRKIIEHEILGHYDFDPVIHRLCTCIANVDDGDDYIASLKMMINANYSLPTIAMNSSSQGVSFGSMINASRPLVYNMVAKNPKLVSQLPFDSLSYDQLLSIVNHNKSYVPINNSRGIELSMDWESLFSLVTYDAAGYLCDIQNEVIGNNLLKKIMYNA